MIGFLINNNGKNLLHIMRRLILLVKDLKKFKRNVGLGNLMGYPSRIAALSWRLLIPYNPGNLGNWSIQGKKINNVTGTYEADVIKKMLTLYGARTASFEGYFTSGATEANIFSAWVGRKKLKQNLREQANIALLLSDLSHYSLRKSADVVGVSSIRVAIRNDWQGMDARALQNTLERLYQKGYRGFLLPLTLGFTLTGTDDDVNAIIETAENFKKKHSDSDFFIWIDAALSGLIQPFTRKKFEPLNDPYIQTFAVDFHKFGKVPIPAGLILYRKELRRIIERPIDYLTEKDSTLLGSRTGISPIAVWCNLSFMGFEGFKKIVDRNLTKKQAFIQQFSSVPDLEIVTSPQNLSLAIVIDKRKMYWSNYFHERYDILFKPLTLHFVRGPRRLLVGKAFFIQ